MLPDRLMPPVQTCKSAPTALPRFLFTALVCWIGVRAGMGYVHMCEAGSRWIELGAMFGIPLATAVWISVTRRLWLTCIAVGALFLTVNSLQQPYLEWAHRGLR